jgi:hypothetical protein
VQEADVADANVGRAIKNLEPSIFCCCHLHMYTDSDPAIGHHEAILGNYNKTAIVTKWSSSPYEEHFSAFLGPKLLFPKCKNALAYYIQRCRCM